MKIDGDASSEKRLCEAEEESSKTRKTERMKRKRARKQAKLEERKAKAAARSIREILSAEENKKKVVFVCTSPHSDRTPRIKAINHDDVDLLGISGDGFPPHLVKNHAYGVALVESSLYFAGGFKFPDHIISDVSVFNLTSKSWSALPPLNHPRSRPLLVVYDGALYAFGSKSCGWLFPDHPLYLLPPHSFAETYDFSNHKWSYLTPPPEEMLNTPSTIVSHAFNEEKSLIFFWFNTNLIYSYHFVSKAWTPFKMAFYSLDEIFPLVWSVTAVFLDSFVIWHYFGTIYRCRLSDGSVRSLFTFPNPSKNFGRPYDFGGYPAPSYLLNVGNGKLCLVYGRRHYLDATRVRCHTFDLRYYRTPSDDIDLTLKHEGRTFFSYEGSEIVSAFSVNQEVVQSINSSCFESLVGA